jgi:hypothetical protein
MPRRRNLPDSSRRDFLKGAGLLGAAGHPAGHGQRIVANS